MMVALGAIGVCKSVLGENVSILLTWEFCTPRRCGRHHHKKQMKGSRERDAATPCTETGSDAFEFGSDKAVRPQDQLRRR